MELQTPEGTCEMFRREEIRYVRWTRFELNAKLSLLADIAFQKRPVSFRPPMRRLSRVRRLTLYWRSPACRGAFSTSYQFNRVDTNDSADQNELSNVEAPLAEFEFRYERLALAEALAQLNLGDARVLSSLHEKLDHSSIEIGAK